MPKGDTWPGGVAMESLSNMDSAGSCDSVISVNSGFSEDSMEYLSAEERACLMYLEETIEALEVQEDSGLSNDEPESVLQAEKMNGMRVNDIFSLNSDEFRRDQGSNKAKYQALNQISEPQSTTAADLQTSTTPPRHPVSESPADVKPHPPASQAKELCVTKDEDGNLKIVSSASLHSGQPAKAPEVDLAMIPPPSDFMDEPDSPPQSEREKYLPPPAPASTPKPGATVDLEQLRQRALSKRHSVIPHVMEEPPNKPPEQIQSIISPAPPLSPPPEPIEPRSPPAVAPKPKRLPANIILKSHKAGVPDITSPPSGSDRMLLDPQRVRLEALRKLGLLKSEEGDPGPALSPKHSPQSRRSWAAPSSPVSPAGFHTPPSTPSYTRINSPAPAPAPAPAPTPAPAPAPIQLQSPPAASLSGPTPPPVVLPPDILPAPAAFSDPDRFFLTDNEPQAPKDVPETPVNAPGNTPPPTPPVLIKKLTPPRVKSATLERSGLGLSSYMASQDLTHQVNGGMQSPSQLRNTRPRPASLGSKKEFGSVQEEGPQVGHAAAKEPDLRRSLPAFQPVGDSQKLPRSEGISVLICPRSDNGDRREALKRLGLLRD